MITFHVVHIDGKILDRVSSVTDLGIMLESRMTFDFHRSAIISKATRQLGVISKVSDTHCWKLLYCALVLPILESESLTWHPHQITWCLKLERVEGDS